MDKKILKFKSTNGRFILNKSKENKNVAEIIGKKQAELLRATIAELKATVKEEKNIAETIVSFASAKSNTNVETKTSKASVGNFQLVVVKKLPWYKKAIKAIANLFKGFNKKGITLKI